MEENEKSLCEGSAERKQEISIFVELKGGKVEKIYNSYISQPTINFKGGSIKWHKDQARK